MAFTNPHRTADIVDRNHAVEHHIKGVKHVVNPVLYLVGAVHQKLPNAALPCWGPSKRTPSVYRLFSSEYWGSSSVLALHALPFLRPLPGNL